VKTNAQLKIDRFVVRPIAWLLNLLVRIAGKLLRINHSLEIVPKKIALCKYKGMGSIVQATPLIQALKIRFPEVEIIFISTEANRKLLEKLPVDNLVLINDKSFLKLISTLPGFLLKLIKNRIDHYLDLEIYAHFSSIVSAFSFSKNRIGFYQRDSQYRMGIYTHMVFFNNTIPVSESYLQLARLLGFHGTSPELYNLAENVSCEIEGLKKEFIVINPNASDLRAERKWPLLQFIELCNLLIQNHPEFQLVLIGSPSETELSEKIEMALNPNNQMLNLAGKTSFDELIFILKKAKLAITNDTGPMHLSNTSNTPTIGLFGPCSPHQYGLGRNLYPVYKQWYCSPCVHEFMTPPCKGDNICMKSIEVNEVYELVKQVLSGKVDNKIRKQDVHFIQPESVYFPGLIKRS
jgi:ADP-heptose:LPS heptosyltransferase